MKDKAQKLALGIVFGVAMQGSVISSIPMGVPGLSRTLGCASCQVKISKGLPTQFVAYMSDEQKKAFKQAMRKKAK